MSLSPSGTSFYFPAEERNRKTEYNEIMKTFNDENDPIITSPINFNDLYGIHREWYLGKTNRRNEKARRTETYVRLQLRNLESDSSRPARFVVGVMFEEFYANWPGGWKPLICFNKIGREIKFSDDFNHELFDELMEIAKKYHSNDLHSGTRRQDACLEEFYPEFHGDYDYDAACEVLKEHGLFVDRGFEYGSKWLFREIPEADLARISDLIMFGN